MTTTTSPPQLPLLGPSPTTSATKGPESSPLPSGQASAVAAIQRELHGTPAGSSREETDPAFSPLGLGGHPLRAGGKGGPQGVHYHHHHHPGGPGPRRERGSREGSREGVRGVQGDGVEPLPPGPLAPPQGVSERVLRLVEHASDGTPVVLD